MTIELEPMDASRRDNYTEDDWKALGRAWADKEPELKAMTDELRRVFPGSYVTYIGPNRNLKKTGLD